MIKAQGLRKNFNGLAAVDDVSFDVRPGEIYGLLGPNGAGKTTTISMICGLLPPTAGSVSVCGHDIAREPAAAKSRLGVVPQEVALYLDLNAEQNLRFWGGLYEREETVLRQRISEILQLVGLADRAREPVRKYSGGMQRRLNLACGLIHQPRVLLLDEPTVGIDPQARLRILEVIQEEARRGTAILYTTHYMEEAEKLCHRIGVIDHGKIIAQGSLGELRALLGEKSLLKLAGNFSQAQIDAALERAADAEIVLRDEESLMLALSAAAEKLSGLLRVLQEAGAEVREVSVREPSLEALFIKLTGRELRE